jgi:hypothetical protein
MEAQSGQYFAKSRPIAPAPHATKADDIERLWQLSCGQIGVAEQWH